MKKLAKKQTGGDASEILRNSKKVISKNADSAIAERMKPHGKQEKFDPSKVKTGLILKKFVKDSTYMPSKKSGGAMSKYKTGGQGPANKIGKMVKISKKK